MRYRRKLGLLSKERGNEMKIIYLILVVIAVVILFMAIKNMKTPAGLGMLDGRLMPLPKSPNAVSSQTEDMNKKVDPLPFKDSLNQTKESIKNALHSYGGIEIVNETTDYIHAVSTTGRMKFNDDLEFYFDHKAGLVHFRSASRVGYSDMGVNKERYNRLKSLYH